MIIGVSFGFQSMSTISHIMIGTDRKPVVNITFEGEENRDLRDDLIIPTYRNPY